MPPDPRLQREDDMQKWSKTPPLIPGQITSRRSSSGATKIRDLNGDFMDFVGIELFQEFDPIGFQPPDDSRSLLIGT